ncbi:expressed unknown protein [Seminavis robusta]|uniref:SP-RING-type domain-containing protein n=1 Tax=Seminavis robusta TaxID=568900 RepID=A0A9N8DWR3_9STRA|nr:expressed unknown protein [Seminavis robusta]|eukprot:Sro434_g142150.1 n/a (785) ;mRNA; r:57189-59543
MYKSSNTCRATNMWRVKKSSAAQNNSPQRHRPVETKEVRAVRHDEDTEAALKDTQSQILAVASYVHQQCREQVVQQKESEALTVPCWSIIQQLMETVSQQTRNVATNNEESVLLSLLKDTKKIAAMVKRMVKLHPVVLFIEISTVLQDLINAMDDIYLTLLQMITTSTSSQQGVKTWKQQQSQLEFLQERAKFDKARLVHPTTPLPPMLQSHLDAGAKELIRVLQRHKRKLFQKAVDETKDETKRERAKQSLEYMGHLMTKLADAPLTQEHQDSMLDTSSYTAMTLDGDASYTTWDASTVCTQIAKMPKWAICPVSKQVMVDPVTVRACCRHTLSQKVFSEWIGMGNKNCPICGCRLQSLLAKVNTQLKLQIAEKMEDEVRSLASANQSNPKTELDSSLPPTFGNPGKASLLEDELDPSAHPSNYENMLLFFNNNGNDKGVNDLDVSLSTIGCSGVDLRDASLGQDSSSGNHFRRQPSFHEEEEEMDEYQVPIKDDSAGRDANMSQSLDQMFHSALNRQTTTDTQLTEVADNRAFSSSVGKNKAIVQKAKLEPLDRPIIEVTATHTLDDSSSRAHRKQAWKAAAKVKQQQHDDDAILTNTNKPTKRSNGRQTRSLSPVRTSTSTQQTEASYLMVDRSSNQQKSKTKNPVKKLFKMLKGGNVKNKEREEKTFRVSANKQDQKNALKMSTTSTTSPAPVVAGKVTVQVMNASAATAMTASMNSNMTEYTRRDDRYDQIASQCVSNNSTLPSGSGHSMTITGRGRSPPRCKDEPPPLVPMNVDANSF